MHIPLSCLPAELWLGILAELDGVQLLQARLVCRQLKDLIDDQYLWQQAYLNTYSSPFHYSHHHSRPQQTNSSTKSPLSTEQNASIDWRRLLLLRKRLSRLPGTVYPNAFPDDNHENAFLQYGKHALCMSNWLRFDDHQAQLHDCLVMQVHPARHSCTQKSIANITEGNAYSNDDNYLMAVVEDHEELSRLLTLGYEGTSRPHAILVYSVDPKQIGLKRRVSIPDRPLLVKCSPTGQAIIAVMPGGRYWLCQASKNGTYWANDSAAVSRAKLQSFPRHLMNVGVVDAIWRVPENGTCILVGKNGELVQVKQSLQALNPVLESHRSYASVIQSRHGNASVSAAQRETPDESHSPTGNVPTEDTVELLPKHWLPYGRPLALLKTCDAEQTLTFVSPNGLFHEFTNVFPFDSSNANIQWTPSYNNSDQQSISITANGCSRTVSQTAAKTHCLSCANEEASHCACHDESSFILPLDSSKLVHVHKEQNKQVVSIVALDQEINSDPPPPFHSSTLNSIAEPNPLDNGPLLISNLHHGVYAVCQWNGLRRAYGVKVFQYAKQISSYWLASVDDDDNDEMLFSFSYSSITETIHSVQITRYFLLTVRSRCVGRPSARHSLHPDWYLVITDLTCKDGAELLRLALRPPGRSFAHAQPIVHVLEEHSDDHCSSDIPTIKNSCNWACPLSSINYFFLVEFRSPNEHPVTDSSAQQSIPWPTRNSLFPFTLSTDANTDFKVRLRTIQLNLPIPYKLLNTFNKSRQSNPFLNRPLPQDLIPISTQRQQQQLQASADWHDWHQEQQEQQRLNASMDKKCLRFNGPNELSEEELLQLAILISQSENSTSH